MRKDNIFTHLYGCISLLGLGFTVWLVNRSSSDDHLFYLSLLAFLIILITFLVLNRVLEILEKKSKNIEDLTEKIQALEVESAKSEAFLNQKVESLENQLESQRNISNYLTGQLGLATPIARRNSEND